MEVVVEFDLNNLNGLESKIHIVVVVVVVVDGGGDGDGDGGGDCHSTFVEEMLHLNSNFDLILFIT